MAKETATLAGGCFWCLEAVFQELRGVIRVKSGYTGGEVEHPTYEQVCSGTTGHAEAVQLEFDPAVVSFRDILKVFFVMHDPTTRNRQGPDIGTQYRSAVFFHDDAQRDVAAEVIDEFNRAGIWKAPIVTEVEPLGAFYPAEDYHDSYYRRNAGQPYCAAVIEPKVQKFRKLFLEGRTGG